MDHPKCRTCGNRHRLGPCPEFVSAKPHIDEARKAVAEKREVRRKIDDANSGRDKPVPSPDLASQPGGVEKGSKSDRLAVAEEAETLKRYRAKAAARQKRYRERMRKARKK